MVTLTLYIQHTDKTNIHTQIYFLQKNFPQFKHLGTSLVSWKKLKHQNMETKVSLCKIEHEEC